MAPGLLFYAIALWLLARDFKRNAGKPSPSVKTLPLKIEVTALIFIFILAFFLRIYRLDDIPAGMHTDQGLTGLYGLWILKGWRPFFEILTYQIPEPLLAYLLAGWFFLVGPSFLSLHLFFIFLGLAAFPLVYWTFRQWAGPRTALLALTLMALMRWNWTAVRFAHPSGEVAFYLFGGLAFLLHGLLNKHKPSIYFSAIFLGLGLYTYQLFKAVPLLCLILGIYEFRHRTLKSSRLALWAGLILAFSLPLLSYFVLNHTAGNRENEVFIGKAITDQHSLKPLWDQALSNVLMFNRTGDSNPRHNLPGTRMLDDITGACFVLGLGLAWFRRHERGGFYPLAGFLLFMGVGSLANDPANSNRLCVLSVFAAYFAGLGLEEIWRRLAFIKKPGWIVPGIGLILLGAVAFQNIWVYFVQMDQDPSCRMAFGAEQTYIGRGVGNLEKSYPGRFRFFIPPLYEKNNTVKFLCDASGAQVTRLDLNDLAKGNIPKDKDPVFFLEEGKAGVLDFLKTLFPGGKEDRLLGPDGRTLVSVYGSQKEKLVSLKPWDRGLQGIYWNTPGFSGKPVTIKTDPLLNLSNKQEFPFQNPPPYSIRWQGSLELPVAGFYQFAAATRDMAAIFVDGKGVFLPETASGPPMNLRKGSHSIQVRYMKNGGDWMALHLIWKHPGSDHWEVVPATAFGKIIQPYGSKF